jgi:hypothetical protein
MEVLPDGPKMKRTVTLEAGRMSEEQLQKAVAFAQALDLDRAQQEAYVPFKRAVA